MSLSFEPNGLLSKPLLPHLTPGSDVPESVDDDFLFVPNGLLVRPPSLSVAQESDNQQDSNTRDIAHEFVPNGLLPSISTSNPEKARDLTPELTPPQWVEKSDMDIDDVDDSLPTVSQLLPPPPPRPEGPQDYIRSTAIRCKTFEGHTITFTHRSKRVHRTPATSASHDVPITGLLEVPIHRLMDQLAMTAVDTAPLADVGNIPRTMEHVNQDMWVDRYRPQRFVDLVGDERVNRETMSWVKEWDQCVFGLKKKKRKLKRKWNEIEDEQDTSNAPEDPWHRPREKILLISGPPGLGKTTLAHVIAKQAGYHVLEVNASDARSGSAIDDRVKPALESGRAMGTTKPVLVIIDEIDGATGENSGAASGFVNKLVALTVDPPKKRRDGGGGSKGKRPLLRPIICICNDLYANSLSKLRLHARIIRMNPSSPLLVSKRLQHICSMEDLTAENRALNLLAEICKGDLRSCLNALQFIKMKSQSVTESIVRTATIGVKEADTSIHSVWTDLLHPISKKRAKNLAMTEEDERKYVSRIARSVEGSGNFDKVVLGVFEHYTTLHPHESTLKRFQAANECLCSYDLLSEMMRSGQEYGLLNYLAYYIVPIYTHLSAGGNPKVERPTVYWESFSKTRSSEDIFASLTKSILFPEGARQDNRTAGLGYRHLLGKDILRTEFVPLLNRIISPNIRPVNKQIIKGDERVILRKLVDIMVSTGLRFELDKADDGQMVYRLEPAIDVFVTYDGKRAGDIAASRYAVRHMVAGEIEAETATRQNDAIEKTPAGGLRGMQRKSRANDQIVGDSIDIADKPATDFFGRPIVHQPPESVQVASSTTHDGASASRLSKTNMSYAINYKYHEGNSSAVRKPTKTSTFL
ncbi:hypothetical protein BS47DRAFT_184538 [Hydnum rufescens UP504]|uniref:AAA+ ATPase domain-containing protein n=1 Tax=Hydnum rufescens UP504 TaxID=1448309 RepID=A0A9P6ANH2_9AGAM|nr:hypothetical protein BS47DRAFT_184538 [Hydnum rufescens UP504]